MDSLNIGCFLSNSAGYGDMWKASPSNASHLKTVGQDHLCRSPNIPDFNIGNFSLSPIDFEPLPNLFSFGPCSSTYQDFPVYKEKNPHDMADVLLSLKHAVVHPGQMSMSNGPLPPLSPAGNFGVYGQQASSSVNNAAVGHGSIGGVPVAGPGATQVSPTSVSFSVHPQAQIMSPGHHGYTNIPQYGHQYSDSPNGMNATGSSLAQALPPSSVANTGNHISHQTLVTGPGQGNLFPSMSVNVSMNMTMGVPGMGGVTGMPATCNVIEQIGSPQQQIPWGSTAPLTSAMPTSISGQHCSGSSFPQGQNLITPLQMSYAATANPTTHPNYGTGSYSFTAEFRPGSCNDPYFDKDYGFKNVNMNLTPFKTLKTTGNYGFNAVSNGKRRSASSRSSSFSTGNFSTNTPIHNEITSSLNNGGLADAASKLNLCRICGKTYARPSTLKTHMRTHSGEKPYRCSTCNKSFSQAANLTAHIRTHSGEKPFRCPICDRRFSQSSSVTTHMRTHSGERPYRCRMCKKAFSDSSTLTKHLRIHSGEKPYQCKLCLLRFSQSGNLNRHMRVHANPA